MKFKLTKNRIITSLVIVVLLTSAFWYGGGTPGRGSWKSSKGDESLGSENETGPIDKAINDQGGEINSAQGDSLEDPARDTPASEVVNDKSKIEGGGIKDTGGESSQGNKENNLSQESGKGKSSPGMGEGSKTDSKLKEEKTNPSKDKDRNETKPPAEENPLAQEPEESQVTDKKLKASLSVRCDTILDNIGWLNPDKLDLVPKNGVIFAKKTVSFNEGESVFDILQREMKTAKIHMEFTFTPMYNSVYIKGIHNLYEFDLGDLSGWMYKVNNWFPNYGASRYIVKQGDNIEWLYTCDLGRDLGGTSAIGGE